MSYPTPWLFTSLDKIVDAEGHIVMEDGTRFYCNIDLDDLVSRINAGAEAEARAERAEKALEERERALEQAVKLGEFEIGKLIAFTNLTTGEECSDDIGQMFITRTDLDSEDWPVSEAPELAKWLQENA